MAEETSNELPSEAELLVVLKDSVREIFESMVIAYSESENASSPEAPLTQARVTFDGPICGAVVLRCSNEGAESIARSLLMMEADEEVAGEEMKDSLGECANLVTGRMKTVALDPHGQFTMSTPEVEEYLPERNAKNLGMLIYHLEAGSLAAEIWVDEAADSSVAA